MTIEEVLNKYDLYMNAQGPLDSIDVLVQELREAAVAPLEQYLGDDFRAAEQIILRNG